MRSGWPRRPGKPFQNVGGVAHHTLEGVPMPPPLQNAPQKSGQTAFRHPIQIVKIVIGFGIRLSSWDFLAPPAGDPMAASESLGT